MCHAPLRLNLRGCYKLLFRRRIIRKPKGFRHSPLETFACNTVVRARDGICRYLLTSTDPNNRFAIALAETTQSSRQTTIALDALCPPRPNYRASCSLTTARNLWAFQQRLEQRDPLVDLSQQFENERPRRALQPYFAGVIRELPRRFAVHRLGRIQPQTGRYLVFYNTERPHHALFAVQYLITNHPERQMLWT